CPSNANSGGVRAREGTRANDPPMTTLENSDARPLPSPTSCSGCGYNLAGLEPRGVSPERAPEIARGRPARDLRACPPMYVRHVRGELRWITWTAALVGTSAACFGIAAATDPFERLLGPGPTAADALLVIGVLAFFGSAGPLGAFERRWRRHPE